MPLSLYDLDNNKADKILASPIQDGLMSKVDKAKLDGLSAYEHPLTHDASMITGLATVATTGNYTDLTNKPTSLPASGGNSDTLDGQHADYFQPKPTTTNTFYGNSAGVAITTGTNNTAIGKNALDSNTDGIDNTALGYSALQANISGQYNTALGSYSLYYNTATDNTALGYASLYTNASGTANTAVGKNALNKNSVVIITPLLAVKHYYRIQLLIIQLLDI